MFLLLELAVFVRGQSEETLARLPGYQQWRGQLLRHQQLQERHLQLLESAQEEGKQDEKTQNVIHDQINTKKGLKEILKQVLKNRLVQHSLAERSKSESSSDNLNNVLDTNEDFDIKGEQLQRNGTPSMIFLKTS